MLRYRRIDKRNKRAQVGETVTWIIATLVIIGVLIIFIWISSLMSKVKAINIREVKTDLGEESEQLATKTFLAEQLNNQNKDIIEGILNKND